MKKLVIRYSVTAGVGLAIAVLVSFARSLYWQEDTVSVLEVLCDCFAVPGLLLILFGLLVFCTNGGTFDIFGFGAKKFFGLFKRERTEKDRESFYEYRKRKQENKRSFLYLIIVGAVFLVIGFIFFLLYHF